MFSRELRAVAFLTLAAASTSASTAWAISGADALLQGQGVATVQGQAQSDYQLSDPFLALLYSRWQSEKNLSFETQQWVGKVLKGEYAQAAHLWSALQPKLGSFERTGQAGYIYLLWKLNVAQTFFDEWLSQLSNTAFRESPEANALALTFGNQLDGWLLSEAIAVSPEQSKLVEALPQGTAPVYSALRAWTALRRGVAARDALEALAPSSPLKAPLALTVALSLARQKDIPGAAKILKAHLEPAIEAKKDAAALSSHYLQIARLLYQTGSLDGAEVFYEKIPNKTPEYLTAREELTWVRLRKNDIEKLRGELTSLTTQVFEEQFAPEVYLVRAVANLKLCYYDQVQADFDTFLKNNRIWAKRISESLAAENPPAPRSKDFFSKLADAAVGKRQAELARLGVLGEESISATLPAVGWQVHWQKAKDRAAVSAESAKKRQAEEYRRQWKNDRAILTEAIRKMQFVKVELLSQMRMAQMQPGTGDAIQVSAAAPMRDPEAPRAATPSAKITVEDGQMTFPFDGVIWPDELFRLRSAAQSRCLKGGAR
jgi:hypothetical protein